MRYRTFLMSHLYVLSDLHIGPPGVLGTFFSGDELVAFLRSRHANAGTLLFNGDLFDFLELPGRPSRLDLERAPEMIEKMLDETAAHPWGPAVFTALHDFVEAGGRVVVVPGNHDLELYHPAADGRERAAEWVQLLDQAIAAQGDALRRAGEDPYVLWEEEAS